MAALILSSNDKTRLDAGFAAAFDTAAERYFSAPGRTEVSGNHTDHQGGCVLGAGVSFGMTAAARRTDTDLIRINSEGFGSFELKCREARMGRNPKTKEAIQIPASKAPVFKAGKAFKDAVAK